MTKSARRNGYKLWHTHDGRKTPRRADARDHSLVTRTRPLRAAAVRVARASASAPLCARRGPAALRPASCHSPRRPACAPILGVAGQEPRPESSPWWKSTHQLQGLLFHSPPLRRHPHPHPSPRSPTSAMTRLYSKGRILGHQRGKHVSHPRTTLVKIDNVDSTEDAQFYLGKVSIATTDTCGERVVTGNAGRDYWKSGRVKGRMAGGPGGWHSRRSWSA